MSEKLKFDVCVVGGGPAGSTTAKFLSEKGLKVVLVEKDKFPRDKPCGGGLTSRVLDEFKYVDSPSLIESYSYWGVAHSPSSKIKIDIKTDKPAIAMVLRKKFDFELIKFALDQGAHLVDNQSVVSIKIFENRAETKLDNGFVIDSEIIVGADGLWSLVAKKTGLRSGSISHGICVFEELKIENEIMDEFFGKTRTCHIHSGLKNVNGYGWIFPKKEHLNIGVGEFILKDNKSRTKHNLLDAYKEYIKILKENKIIPESVTINKVKGGALPLAPLKKTYSKRVILVGDAAGFVSPLNGEGIYYAMKSGKIAAEVIAKALEEKDTSEKYLSKYQHMWKKDFGRDIKALYKIRRKMDPDKVERSYKIANLDPVLANLIIRFSLGEISLYANRWKIIKRYIRTYLRYKFSRK